MEIFVLIEWVEDGDGYNHGNYVGIYKSYDDAKNSLDPKNNQIIESSEIHDCGDGCIAIDQEKVSYHHGSAFEIRTVNLK